ncbi:hypothetical protein [Breznakiella homolactica]|uniref:Uncharacterized protein n=1 Tax=Breznakiella homolactica TaxID=2798577 RepID=A0A7T7XMH4_9SPIR|nr:hypothetical protein [Breznakiella homolactica]QQO08997.1 hypothetical protein JFL75_19015 [Breznakiella homolactica]
MGEIHRYEAQRLIQRTVEEFSLVLYDLDWKRRKKQDISVAELRLSNLYEAFYKAASTADYARNGLKLLNSEGLAELLGMCRELANYYDLPVRTSIPEGALGIGFDIILWFEIEIRNNALERLNRNKEELWDLRGELIAAIRGGETSEERRRSQEYLNELFEAKRRYEAVQNRIWVNETLVQTDLLKPMFVEKDKKPGGSINRDDGRTEIA